MAYSFLRKIIRFGNIDKMPATPETNITKTPLSVKLSNKNRGMARINKNFFRTST